MYRKRNDAIVFFSSLDTALNRLIRFKFIYKLFHLERNSKKCMQTCLQTYSQFYILPCFFKHLREALQRQVIFFVVVVHLCNSGFTQLGEEKFKWHKQLSGVLSGLVLVFFFEGQRDKWESLQGHGADRLKLNFQAWSTLFY